MLHLLIHYISPQGGDVAAQFPDDLRQACQFVLHTNQQEPAQHHGKTEIPDKAEYFGNVHLQPHFPLPGEGLLAHHIRGDGAQAAFHRFHDIAACRCARPLYLTRCKLNDYNAGQIPFSLL